MQVIEGMIDFVFMDIHITQLSGSDNMYLKISHWQDFLIN